MRDTELLLPAIPEDYNEVGTYRKENFFNPDEYRPIVDVLYIIREKEISIGRISRKEKKKQLSDILNKQKDISDTMFLKRLKSCIPEGLAINEICTDSEYEALKAEFNL